MTACVCVDRKRKRETAGGTNGKRGWLVECARKIKCGKLVFHARTHERYHTHTHTNTRAGTKSHTVWTRTHKHKNALVCLSGEFFCLFFSFACVFCPPLFALGCYQRFCTFLHTNGQGGYSYKAKWKERKKKEEKKKYLVKNRQRPIGISYLRWVWGWHVGKGGEGGGVLANNQNQKNQGNNPNKQR